MTAHISEKKAKVFARLNVAAPLETVKEASKRIASVFESKDISPIG